MNEYSDAELCEVAPEYKLSMSSVEELLSSCGLKYEKLDYMAALFDENNKALACGGYTGSTIKCVAVSEEARGNGLSNKMISHLLNRLYSEGKENVTLYTKPENENMFVSFGFKLIERTEKTVFMERGRAFDEYLHSLSEYRKEGQNGAVVMNCNPFTKGHLYLAEYASCRCDRLYVFVVREDRSVFPFNIRYRLVKEGLSHVKNITVLEGGPYIISNAAFPSYFLKEYSEVTKSHAQLDLKIFAKYIAPALNIKKRFVGEELTDRVTLEYNNTMEEILPKYNMDRPIVIPRKADRDGNAISAGNIRKWLAQENNEKVRQTVPGVTYSFLMSGEASSVIKRIKYEYRSFV